jgi:cytoskeletal protein RodZ
LDSLPGRQTPKPRFWQILHPFGSQVNLDFSTNRVYSLTAIYVEEFYMGMAGDLLRSARESKGLSLGQVEQGTRIRAKLLEALEQGDYTQLPAPVFVKGFLRNYAQFLELNPEEVLKAYRAEAGEAVQVFTPKALSEPLESSRSPLASLVLVLLVVILMGIGAWWSYSQGWIKMPTAPTQSVGAISPTTATRQDLTPTATQTTATLTVAPTATETTRPETPPAAATPSPSPSVVLFTLTPSNPASTSGIHVELQITARAWMRVYADGQRVFEGFAEKGTTQIWDAAKQLYIHCGYGSGVRAIVNGQEYGLLSQAPDTVRVEWTLAVGTPSVEEMIIPTQIVLPLGLSDRTPQTTTPTVTPTR